MAIFRRLSTTFNKKKDEKSSVNGTSLVKVEETSHSQTNGAPALNEHSIGNSMAKTAEAGRRHSSHAPASRNMPERRDDRSNDAPATRHDVVSTFEQFAQLIHASRKPLPVQTGDGSYLEKNEPSGFWKDIKSLGLKDVKTVKHIMEDKASGKPQDDRKMHMEEIMQVRGLKSFIRNRR